MKTQQTEIVETTEARGMNPDTDRFIEPGEQPATPPQAQGNTCPATAGHSPLPWRVQVAAGQVSVAIDSQQIAKMWPLPVSGQDKANAAFIVRACNNVENLAMVVRYMMNGGTDTRVAREALAQWEGGKQ